MWARVGPEYVMDTRLVEIPVRRRGLWGVFCSARSAKRWSARRPPLPPNAGRSSVRRSGENGVVRNKSEQSRWIRRGGVRSSRQCFFLLFTSRRATSSLLPTPPSSSQLAHTCILRGGPRAWPRWLSSHLPGVHVLFVCCPFCEVFGATRCCCTGWCVPSGPCWWGLCQTGSVGVAAGIFVLLARPLRSRSARPLVLLFRQPASSCPSMWACE